MNIHMIHGRLTRDPEITRGSESTKDRAKFTVATDRRYGDDADFFDCTVFGKRANVIDKYFHKGSEILLTGEGQMRSYEDKNGVKRRAYSILVSDFDFCGSSGSAPKHTEPEPEPHFEEVDEDIPF